MSTTADAIKVARLVEPVAVRFGAHVALTGGCLYKDGARKDIDLFFYGHRGGPGIDRDGLLAALVEELRFVLGERKGTVRKSYYDGHSVDLFFRELPPEFETPNGYEYPEDPILF